MLDINSSDLANDISNSVSGLISSLDLGFTTSSNNYNNSQGLDLLWDGDISHIFDDIFDDIIFESTETLTGDDEDNILIGGLENNILIGGKGNDTLTGGDGEDIFSLNLAKDEEDTILDFSYGKDLIELNRGLVFEDLTITTLGGNKVVISINQPGADYNDQPLAVLENVNLNLFESFGEENFISLGAIEPSADQTFDSAGYEDLIKDVRADGWTVGESPDQNLTYTVNKVFDDTSTGFYAVGFTSETRAPLLVVRGTDGEILDILDDINPKGLGFDQFTANKNEVFEWLENVSVDKIDNPNAYHPSIVGESLGGVLSQSLAAEYTNRGENLSHVITFNSPGTNYQLADLFNPEKVDLVKHFIVHGDIVSLVGDEYIQGEYILMDWDTPDSRVFSIFPYIVDKHNQDNNEDLADNPSFNTNSNLNSEDLGSPLFSYWTASGVNGEARKDWALFNFTLGILSGGVIPGILSTRGSAELGRSTLGTLIRTALGDPSASVVANNVLRAGNIIDNVGDVFIDQISGWNREMWETVSEWDPGIWTAIELSGVPAATFLAVGGLEAAQALNSGGIQAATSLIAGGVEAFDALIGGGVQALQALTTGNFELAWDVLAEGGEEIWQILKNRGVEAWDELLEGGDEAWQALKNAAEDAAQAAAEAAEAAARAAVEAAEAAAQAVAEAAEAAARLAAEAAEATAQAIAEAAEAVAEAAAEAAEAAEAAANDVGDAIADFFGW
jgi:hypothetical protein